MRFSGQYWSGLPCPSPGDLPNPGIEPRSPALQADSSPWRHLRSPQITGEVSPWITATLSSQACGQSSPRMLTQGWQWWIRYSLVGAEFRPPAWTGRFLSETSSTPLEASGYTITPTGSPRPSQGCCGEGTTITFPIMFPKRQVSAPCRLEGWLQGRGICTGQLPTQNRKITEGHMLIPNPVPPLQLFLKFFIHNSRLDL